MDVQASVWSAILLPSKNYQHRPNQSKHEIYSSSPKQNAKNDWRCISQRSCHLFIIITKHNLPSAKQLAGHIKLVEAWKSVNIENYPFKMEPNKMNPPQIDRMLWPGSIKMWKDNAKTRTGSNSFSIDTAKLWNNCPEGIKNACSLSITKKKIKLYSKTFELWKLTLPILLRAFLVSYFIIQIIVVLAINLLQKITIVEHVRFFASLSKQKRTLLPYFNVPPTIINITHCKKCPHLRVLNKYIHRQSPVKSPDIKTL